MDRTVLKAMLDARPELSASAVTYTAAERGQLSLLLLPATGGPVPLARIRSVELGDAFVTATTDEAIYCLPYAHIVGIKVASKSDKTPSRTGFRP